MPRELSKKAASAEAKHTRLLAKWDAHLATRGVSVAELDDFVSFGSLSRLENLHAALRAKRSDQIGCIRLALRLKRSEKWRKANPVAETSQNRKVRVPAKLSLPEDHLPRAWRRALRDMRQSRETLDRGLIDLDDRDAPSRSVMNNLTSTLRVFAQVCEEHGSAIDLNAETVGFFIAARHAAGNVSVSIAARLKELLVFSRWCDLDDDIVAKIMRLQKRYARAAEGERKRKETWAAESGVALGDVLCKSDELLRVAEMAPAGSALQATLTLDAVCLAFSVVCPLRSGDLHRIVIGEHLTRTALGWSLNIVTQKGQRPYHRPDLWPELTPFLDALIMLDMAGQEFWRAYESKSGVALFSRYGEEACPSKKWPSICWRRHFGTGAHIIRSLWHSLMFESEDDEQWIALALCGQVNARTAQHYILEGRKKRSSRRGRAKIKALRQAHVR